MSVRQAANLRSLGETPASLAQATDLKVREISRRIAAAKAAASTDRAAPEQTGETSVPPDGQSADVAMEREQVTDGPDAAHGRGGDQVREAPAVVAGGRVCPDTDSEGNDTVPDTAVEQPGRPGGEPSVVTAVPDDVPPAGVAISGSLPGPPPDSEPGAVGRVGARAAPPRPVDRWRTAVAETLF